MGEGVLLRGKLILASREREEALAFEELYERYMPRIYAYLRYRVGSASEAEDLTATVFECALAGLGSYRPDKAPFVVWLWRIARNVLIDHYRKLSKRQHLPLEEAVPLASREPMPEEWALREEEVRRLRTHLEALSGREQEIVALKFGLELTNRRIAEMLGMNERTVGSIIFRALRKLKKRLEE
ncbi:MAG: sigma-70 family RNA polymerase sigma factor [Anaerolineae bacterium]|nr:sigma-70 family RNA polymerase sigma factor [Anaerolineae bacterium]